jgi:hypothetical protein
MGHKWSDAQREKYNNTIRERREGVKKWSFDFDIREEYE